MPPGLTRIGIDEISYKRGHKYLTVVVDHDTGAPRRPGRRRTRTLDSVGTAQPYRIVRHTATSHRRAPRTNTRCHRTRPVQRTRPLPEYERAFAELADEPAAWRRNGQVVAVRFPDPEGRRDAAGRVIPHEFVVFGDGADVVNSVYDGEQHLWPLVEQSFEHVWDADTTPSFADLRFE
ncbi:hypothetical protein BJD99_05670 [Rhodococcus sp. 1163]|nr:hypothetical protein BJD99_05670 [Rhodococcus sp. 1163]